ncbi:WecB/TagA/CpsF family glycosyltransferase [Qipengyuania sediminis]|uniref:WecB/TagA/CpsF family glycosyltransferase n=1 Tax=Qipengyuania sediminis TaxID=1532023 RepID=UPI0014049331|nr:WecB/TagA/CpsF family glycosyltransferase [Qipengyuania sediminis]
MTVRIAFLGFRFAPLSMEEAVRWAEAQAKDQRFGYIVTPNVDHAVMLGEGGPQPWRGAYRAAVEGADLVLNDSRVLARLARLSGIVLPVTPGSDLTRVLLARAAGREGGTLALVGGGEGELAWLQSALPGWRVAHCDPPMGVRDDPAAQAAIAGFVEAADAEMVLFAIGAPQSEITAHAIARAGRARGVGLCIGASIEFLSGAKARAPRWIQRAGLEWLHRLASEPGRLWRRYLLRGPRVFGLWWQERRRGAGASPHS